ncbi:MAG: phosphoenolpyruvate carboxykinase (ATP), partial [Sphingomonadaceae bacterium]|nr:phosphoenolpyruvate carboxykinase (ATP) [Sphingomonadaceae bacterium]
LSGYTAKVAGTEKGLVGVQPEFSTCFGSPFLPRHPSVYANLLQEYIQKHNVDVWLVNSGWTGGIYGVGRRMPIKATRGLLNAVLDGKMDAVEFRKDPNFGFDVPVHVPALTEAGIDQSVLDPRSTWADKEEHDATARKLVELFVENFAQFENHVDERVRQAAPQAA